MYTMCICTRSCHEHACSQLANFLKKLEWLPSVVSPPWTVGHMYRQCVAVSSQKSPPPFLMADFLVLFERLHYLLYLLLFSKLCFINQSQNNWLRINDVMKYRPNNLKFHCWLLRRVNSHNNKHDKTGFHFFESSIRLSRRF